MPQHIVPWLICQLGGSAQCDHSFTAIFATNPDHWKKLALMMLEISILIWVSFEAILICLLTPSCTILAPSQLGRCPWKPRMFYDFSSRHRVLLFSSSTYVQFTHNAAQPCATWNTVHATFFVGTQPACFVPYNLNNSFPDEAISIPVCSRNLLLIFACFKLETTNNFLFVETISSPFSLHHFIILLILFISMRHLCTNLHMYTSL